MRQCVGHHAPVFSPNHLAEYVRMLHGILVRAPYPQRHIELLVRQPWCNLRTVVASVVLESIVETLLSVVRQIYDNRFLILEFLQNAVHDGVVIYRRVVIMRQDVAVACGQVGPVIIVSVIFPVRFGVAGVVTHVLTHKMKDCQIMLFVVFLQLVIVRQYAVIKLMQRGVAGVELRLVQEETATEVIHSFFGLRQELIGDERNVVARLSEYLWE